MNCPNCGTANREGELICRSCGRMLVVPAETRRIKVSAGLLPERERKQTTDRLKTITFEVDDVTYNFAVQSGDEILIGRGYPSTIPNAAALDLTNANGSERGVSRKHAMVRVEGQSAYLIDLASTNGTFLNGRRLEPQHRHLLYTDDVVRFGALEVRIKLS